MGPLISSNTCTLVLRPICLFALQVGLTTGLFGEPPRAPRDLGDCRFPVITLAIKFEQAHKTKGKIQLECKFSPGRSKSYAGFSSEALRSYPGLAARHKKLPANPGWRQSFVTAWI